MINGLVDIVYPKTCVICKKKIKGHGSIDNVICAECWGKVKKNLPPFCHCCGRNLHRTKSVKNICVACVKKPPHFDRAFSPCVYEGTIKELIHEFKYKNKEHLGSTLSRLMVEFIKEYNVPVEFLDLIVPLPLHKTRLREREFNQAQILSRHIAKEFNKEVSSDSLIRHRYTRTQTELNPEERILNVKDCFSVKEPEIIKNKNILLVDDVSTTQATSSEAAFALKESGANIVFVLTLAN
jgi:ComF family protein